MKVTKENFLETSSFACIAIQFLDFVFFFFLEGGGVLGLLVSLSYNLLISQS